MKPLWKSKTIAGVVVTLLAATLPKFSGVPDGSEVADLTEALVAVAGAALAVYGRFVAKEGLHL